MTLDVEAVQSLASMNCEPPFHTMQALLIIEIPDVTQVAVFFYMAFFCILGDVISVQCSRRDKIPIENLRQRYVDLSAVPTIADI